MMRRASVMVMVMVMVMLGSTRSLARTGMGDPVEVFREHAPDDLVSLHGHVRLRSQFSLGVFDEDVAHGHDARARFTPSLFLGDFRLFLDADVVDASIGPIASHEQPGDGASFLDVRALGFDWMLPIGVISIGRMPAHFALGIAANDGAGLDDDGGDRAERIALVMPIFGFLFAVAADALPYDSILGEQAVSIGFMKWRAPWEIEMQRGAGRTTFDWGGAISLGGASKDVPGLHATLARAVDPANAALQVRRDTRFVLADIWARLVVDRYRVEAEAWAADLVIENPSPFAGVIIREPIVGNPAAFAIVTEARLLEPTSDALFAQLELGAASADPAFGFPFANPSTATPAYSTRTGRRGAGSVPDGFKQAGPGDTFGPQITLANDMRFDAARIQPLHRVDLILWRTMLGGVSEAAYVRGHVDGELFRDDAGNTVRLDGNLVYSHGIAAGPLGVELDAGVVGTLGDASLRVDLGSLYPLAGLLQLGKDSMAHMALVRLGYAL
jgi:hypothetical protein